MKSIFSFLLLFFLLGIQAQSQNDRYTEAMQNAMSQLQQASTGDDYIQVANSFERIAVNQKGEWLPWYYAAYTYIIYSFPLENINLKDQYLDKAQKFIDAGLEIAPEESELYALQGFLIPAKIMADPMSRGPELVGKLYYTLDEAERLNPENPRTYFLRGVTVLNMPVEFGGGPSAAKPILLKAKEKFDAFQPSSRFSPKWGKEETEAELSKL